MREVINFAFGWLSRRGLIPLRGSHFFLFPRLGALRFDSVARFIPRRLFASQLLIGDALVSDVLRGLDESI
jgi:hypothetical protein